MYWLEGEFSCVKVKDIIKDCCSKNQSLIYVWNVSAVKVGNNIDCEATCNGCCCKKDDDNNNNCKPESEAEIK